MTTERIVAEPVIAAIAADAALRTPGVVRLEPGVAGLLRQLADRVLGAPPAHGVEVRLEEKEITVHLALAVSARRKVATTALDVQERVAEAVVANTGVARPVVSVSIVDIAVPRGHGE